MVCRRTQHRRTAQPCGGPQRAAGAAMARGARQPQHACARYECMLLSSGRSVRLRKPCRHFTLLWCLNLGCAPLVGVFLDDDGVSSAHAVICASSTHLLDLVCSQRQQAHCETSAVLCRPGGTRRLLLRQGPEQPQQGACPVQAHAAAWPPCLRKTWTSADTASRSTPLHIFL